MNDLRDVRGPSAQRPAHSSRSSRGLQNSFKLLDDRNISRSSGSKAAHKPAPRVRFYYLSSDFFVLNFNRSSVFLCDLPEEQLCPFGNFRCAWGSFMALSFPLLFPHNRIKI